MVPWVEYLHLFFRSITPEELEAFESDRERFKSEELSLNQQNASIDVNLDQNFDALQTNGWDLPQINDLIIIRK